MRSARARLHRFSFSRKHGGRDWSGNRIEELVQNFPRLATDGEKLTNHSKRRLWKIVLILDRVKKERGNSERCKTRLVEARIFNRGRNLFVRETSGQNRRWRGREPAENRRIVPHWRIFSSSRPRYFIQLLEWTRAKRTIRTEGKKEKTRKKGRKEGCRKDEGKKRVENWSLREEPWSFVCGRMITVRVTMTRRKRSISLWEM